MSKKRQRHTEQAIALLREKPYVSALELGSAAMAGEACRDKMHWRNLQDVGLMIGSTLVRDGVATVSRGNCFRYAGPVE